MGDQISRAKLLDQFIQGIDYIIQKSEPFGSAFGNQLRTHLFNARTTVETLKLDQELSPSADDVDAGTPATGATPAQNFAGTGIDPIITTNGEKTEEKAPAIEDDRPANVPTNVWDNLTAEQRAALTASEQLASLREQLASLPHPLSDTADTVAPEDDPATTSSTPPWESPDA